MSDTTDQDTYGIGSDPDKLREHARNSDALAAVLRDRADRQRIAADLITKLHNLADERAILTETEITARGELGRALGDLAAAEASNRNRAEKVFKALAAEVGEDIAAKVADPIASAAAERDQAEQVSGLANRLDSAEVPADLREAAVKAIADRDRAEVEQLHAVVETARRRVAEAERDLMNLSTRETRLRTALANPLGVYTGDLSESWLRRLSRPEVYRDLLTRRRAGLDVHPDLGSVAVLVAGQAWHIDADLAGDLTAVDRALSSEPVLRAQVKQLGELASLHGLNAPAV